MKNEKKFFVWIVALIIMIIIVIFIIWKYTNPKSTNEDSEIIASQIIPSTAMDKDSDDEKTTIETTMDKDSNDEKISNDSIDFGAKSALEKENLTVEEMLRYAIEDEYLARQEYESIMEEYGEQKPFSNIITAEVNHIEMLVEIYTAYDYDIPKDTAIDHVVIPESIFKALEIGVQAEIDNIAMYDYFLEYDLPEDIEDLFIKLRDASKKHLVSFQNGVDRGK